MLENLLQYDAEARMGAWECLNSELLRPLYKDETLLAQSVHLLTPLNTL